MEVTALAATIHIVFFPISTDDVLDNHFLLNSQEFDIIQVIQHKLTLNNFVGLSKCSVLMDNDSVMAISANSDCAIIPQPNTCNAPIQQSTTVVNSPNIFFVGYTHNPSKKHIPSLPVDSKYATWKLITAHTEFQELFI